MFSATCGCRRLARTWSCSAMRSLKQAGENFHGIIVGRGHGSERGIPGFRGYPEHSGDRSAAGLEKAANQRPEQRLAEGDYQQTAEDADQAVDDRQNIG